MLGLDLVQLSVRVMFLRLTGFLAAGRPRAWTGSSVKEAVCLVITIFDVKRRVRLRTFVACLRCYLARVCDDLIAQRAWVVHWSSGSLDLFG